MEPKDINQQNNFLAPMPGLVIEVYIELGQFVKQGKALIIIEAMKMEYSIRAPHDGTITTINVEAGDTVKKGQELIRMDL